MKRFMQENVITHNLMSLSGFKGIFIFSLLIEKPCSYNDIIKEFENNEYINETASKDTIRIYFNSLKSIGCVIKSYKVNKITKYYIEKTPFDLKITDEQINALIYVFKSISKSIDLSDYLILKSFFDKIFLYIKDQTLKDEFNSISPINYLDKNLIDELVRCAQNNTAIKILYNSKISGREKYIDILLNKIYISNNKLYISGINSEYKNYSSFLVSRIRRIEKVNVPIDKLKVPTLVVQYHLSVTDLDFEPLDYEKIVSSTEDGVIIEATTENKFELIQRILYFGSKCKVISPNNFKKEIISCLKRMKEGYIDE